MRHIFAFLLILMPFAAQAQGEAERGWLEGIIEDNLSSAGRQVNITGFQGALSSRATMTELTIADDDGVWLTMRGLVLDWSRSALLAGRVEVSELSAEEIIVARAPVPPEGLEAAPSPEATPFSLPELPVSVNVGRLLAARVELGAPLLGEAVVASLDASARLSGGEGEVSLTANRTDGQELQIALDASYGNESRQLALDLNLAEGADGLITRTIGLPGAPAIDLTVQGTGPIDDYRADIALATDDQPRLTGAVTLNGDAFTADISGDIAPLFLPDYAEFFGPNIALNVEGSRNVEGVLDLPVLSLTSQALNLNGGVTIGADGLPDRVALTGRIAAPDGQPVLLPLSTDRTLLTSADLDIAFDASQSDDWRGQIRIDGLDRDDFDAESLVLDGTGTIAPGNVTGDLTFTAAGLAPADPGLAQALGPEVTGSARLQSADVGAGLNIERLRLNGEGYSLRAHAIVEGLSTGLTISGDGVARIEDLSRAATLAGMPLSGTTEARIGGRYAALEGGFDVQVDMDGTDLAIGQPQVDGLLAGDSVIRLSAQRDEAGTRIRSLNVNAQTLTATAQGLIASNGSDITANVNFSDLSPLGAGYGGALRGDLAFTGTVDQGRVTFDAAGDTIRTGIAEVDGLLRGPSVIRVDAGLNAGTVTLTEARVNATTLTLTANGTLAEAGSDVTADLNFTDLSVLGSYRGTLVAQAGFSGTPEDGRVTLTGRGTNLAIGQAEADRLLRGDSTIDVAARLTGGQPIVERANITNPQMSLQATGTAIDGGQSLDLNARLANLGLVLPDFPGAVTLAGTVAQRASGYDLNLTANGPGGINLRSNGTVAADFGSANLGLSGSAQAALANVFLSPRSVSGPLAFDLRLNGPLALSSVSGQARMTGGRLADPELGFALNDIGAQVDLSGSRARIAVQGNPEEGGRIGVNGTVGLDAPNTADLTVDLSRVQYSDPQLFRTIAGGQIRITGPLTGGALIAGTVALEETEVQIPSGGFGASGRIDGLIHVNEPAVVRQTRQRAGLIEEPGSAGGEGGTPFGLNLLISAPNQIFIRGRGLDAELGGELRLTGDTNNIVPIGAFNLIRGRLDILGRRLDLSEASLQLEGNFVPQLRVVASSSNNGVTSYVNITGRADEPEVTFSSNPDLPQEEVLAQLLFGRDLSTISPLQAAQLANAVATLAGRGGEGIVGNLRQGFGLDDLDVTTGDSGAAAVRAGKYISQNVYTEVEVDSQGESEISLNLDVSDSLTVRGSAGNEGNTGIGIFWERDY
ncbi:translocation/assembly module TamB domain-containing protein [Falsirhodobacter xinxiangensis]|uniref:translocation/assembly module TamB domain-containing protein n=1 Tax=Falsirhodobacter xinxiangensis TaxID=2530049 RepID=UPI0010AB18C8|nr:translocation/assembly module TamB domain-containing protein [Rhodobacter xinxiangensis]